MDPLLLLQAFLFIAPAYAANGFPPLMRGKTPIDGRKMFKGHRLLGDGKTLEGFLGGVIFGVFIGSLQIYGQSYLPAELGLAAMTFPIVFMLSIGTMAGDKKTLEGFLGGVIFGVFIGSLQIYGQSYEDAENYSSEK